MAGETKDFLGIGSAPSGATAAPASSAPLVKNSSDFLGVRTAAPVAAPAPAPAPAPSGNIFQRGFNAVKAGVDNLNADASAGLQKLFGDKPQPPPAPIPADFLNVRKAADGSTKPPPKSIAPGTVLPNDPQNFAMDSSTQAVPDASTGDTVADIKGIAQGIPRDAARVGVSIGQAALNLMGKGKGSDISIQPTGVMADVIGDKPVTGLADDAAEYERAIKNSDFAKKYGIDKFATPLGVIGATGPVGLDFLGAGGEESVVKALAASTDVSEVAKILRQVGVHEDLVLPLAQHIANTSDEQAIRDALKTAEALQRTSHAVRPADDPNTLHQDGGMPSAADAVAKSVAHDTAPEIDAAAESEQGAVQAADKPIGAAMKAAAPRAASSVEKDLESMVQYQSFLDDTLHDMPGRPLMKYRSSATGDLPYMEKGATSKFGKKGDVMLQDIMGQDESGNGDYDVANAKLQEYVKARDEKRLVDDQVKALRAELRASRSGEKASAKAQRVSARAAAKRAQDSFRPDELPVARKTYSEKLGSQSTGDYLRRGAERVMPGAKPIAPNVAKGVASDQAQRAAILETVAGDIESGPFKGFSTQVKNWYQDWIFARQASSAETKLALKPFEDLRTEDMKWIDEYTGATPDKDGFRSGVSVADRSGIKSKVEELLNSWLSQEQAAGIKVADKANYFPIYLKDPTAGELEDTLGDRRVGIKPSFSLQSQFKDYAEARAAGYEPKYSNPYDILKARAQAHFKAMADANMFRSGVGNGWLIPEQAVVPDLKREFRVLDPNSFPHMAASYGNTVNVRNYSAPAALADKIDTYLRKPNETLQKAARVAGTLKNTALSVGVPGTGMSVHFYNVLPREVLADIGLNPATAPFQIGKYFYYGINPRAAGRYIEANLERAMPLIRAGMKFSAEEHDASDAMLAAFKKVVKPDGTELYTESATSRLGKAGKATSDFLHKVFGGNTFDKLIPARKIENGLKIFDMYVKKGVSADEAARLAADDVNTLYGGINWEAMGRDRNLQNFMRTSLMASDFAETNIRLGSRMVKAFTNPKSVQAQLYRRMVYALLAVYGTANIFNYERTGHFMWQNDILHQFSLDTGPTKNGKEGYWNIFGTGADFARLPMQVATSIAKGNYDDLNSIIRNRLSIPVASAFSLIENVDWKGDPILGPDKYGNVQSKGQQAQNVFDNTIGNVLPGSLQPLGPFLQGKETAPQFATQAVGLPISYKNITPNSTDISALKAKAAAGIKSGDYRLFNQLVKAGAIPRASRSSFIQTSLRGKSPKQVKAAAKAKAKTAAVEKSLLNEGFTSSD